jgi:hypothetical protein
MVALQESARSRFWDEIGRLGIKRWRPGEPFVTTGTRILLGVGPAYSRPDLALVESIVKRLKENPQSDLTIELFDILDVPDMRSMGDFVPGIGNVYHTPVIGVWRNGTLEEKGSGHIATKIAVRVFSLTP